MGLFGPVWRLVLAPFRSVLELSWAVNYLLYLSLSRRAPRLVYLNQGRQGIEAHNLMQDPPERRAQMSGMALSTHAASLPRKVAQVHEVRGLGPKTATFGQRLALSKTRVLSEGGPCRRLS